MYIFDVGEFYVCSICVLVVRKYYITIYVFVIYICSISVRFTIGVYYKKSWELLGLPSGAPTLFLWRLVIRFPSIPFRALSRIRGILYAAYIYAPRYHFCN